MRFHLEVELKRGGGVIQAHAADSPQALLDSVLRMLSVYDLEGMARWALHRAGWGTGAPLVESTSTDPEDIDQACGLAWNLALHAGVAI